MRLQLNVDFFYKGDVDCFMDFLSIMSYRAKFGRIYRGYIMSNDMKVHSGHTKKKHVNKDK